jgi:hypothetical protein
VRMLASLVTARLQQTFPAQHNLYHLNGYKKKLQVRDPER